MATKLNAAVALALLKRFRDTASTGSITLETVNWGEGAWLDMHEKGGRIVDHAEHEKKSRDLFY